jgi:hypothetical protein
MNFLSFCLDLIGIFSGTVVAIIRPSGTPKLTLSGNVQSNLLVSLLVSYWLLEFVKTQ